jgi:hypothetical protein
MIFKTVWFASLLQIKKRAGLIHKARLRAAMSMRLTNPAFGESLYWLGFALSLMN